MEVISDEVECNLLVTRLEQLVEEANRDLADNDLSDYKRLIDRYNELHSKLSRFFPAVFKNFQRITITIKHGESAPDPYGHLKLVASDANAILRGIKVVMGAASAEGEEPLTGPLGAILPQGVLLPGCIGGL